MTGYLPITVRRTLFGFLLKLLHRSCRSRLWHARNWHKSQTTKTQSLNGYGWTALVVHYSLPEFSPSERVFYEFTTTAAKDKAAQAQTQQLFIGGSAGHLIL